MGPGSAAPPSKGRCAASGARARVRRTHSPPRMRRRLRPSDSHFEFQTHARSLAAHPSFASFLPLEKEGAGKAGCRQAPAVCCAKRHTQKTAQQHTGVAEHAAFPAQWSDGLCRALPGAEFLLASLAPRIDDAVCPVGLARISARGLTVATTARTTRFCRTQLIRLRQRGFAGLRRRSSARSLGLTGTTRPARASRARRCRVHRNPARVSNDSRTAPLRRAGLRRSMP